MLRMTASPFLFFSSCLFPITAKVEQGEINIGCCLRYIDEVRSPTDSFPEDCNAALGLIPYTGYEVNPDFIQRNYAGPEKPISLELFAKVKVAGSDKIRLPAMFHVRSCMIIVTPRSPDQPPKGIKVASMLYDHLWPRVHEGVIAVLERCVKGKEPGCGRMDTQLYMDDWLFAYSVEVDTKPKQLDRHTFWAKYNIYTPAGQVNDIRWSTPFQPPSGHL